jgi:hypothetical protein
MATLIAPNGSTREVLVTDVELEDPERITFADGSSMLVGKKGPYNTAASGLCALKKRPRDVLGAAVFLSREETQ